MDMSIDDINNACGFSIKILSPNVAYIQMHLNIFEERDKEDISLPSRGYVKCNLHLNAETE